MAQYRIKLSSGRIIGPFAHEQIGELYLLNQLDGAEQYQSLGQNEWHHVDHYRDLAEYLIDLIENEYSLHDLAAKDKTRTVQKIMALQHARDAENTKTTTKFAEFQYEKKGIDEVQQATPSPAAVGVGESEEAGSSPDIQDKSSELAKTRVMRPQDIKADETTLAKTRILPNRPPPPPKEDSTIIQQEAGPSDEEESSEGHTVTTAASVDDEANLPALADAQTQVAHFKTDLANLPVQLAAMEKALQAQAEQENPSSANEAHQDTAEEEQPSTPKSFLREWKWDRRHILVVTAAILFLILMFYDPDLGKSKDPYQLKFIRPQFSFPIPDEVVDHEQAEKLYFKGQAAFNSGNYLGQLNAQKFWGQSAEKEFNDNPAVEHLVQVLGMLVADVADDEKINAGQVMAKILQIKQSKLLTDTLLVMGAAEFYFNYGHTNTALNILEHFLQINKLDPQYSMEYLALYLKVAVEIGDILKAQDAAKPLLKVDPIHLSPAAILALGGYFQMEQDLARGPNLVAQGLKSHPSSVPLLLQAAEFSWESKNYEQLGIILERIFSLQAEKCPRYVAHYYELMGLLQVVRNNVDVAAKLFSKALEIRESDSLRAKLAVLKLGGNQQTETLISDSKVMELVRLSKLRAAKGLWDDAFRLAIEAADINNYHITAKLWLAELQGRQGFYLAAISTLEALRKIYPLHQEINFNLAKAYIQAHLWPDAEAQLQKISQTNLAQTSTYASLLGHMYKGKDSPLLALKWFQEGVNRDPMNADDYYQMAVIFEQQNQFSRSKMALAKALALDPVNLDYHILYAKTLYELQGTDAAVGYLRDLESSFGEDARLLGQMAIFYYRSGQIKLFKDYKKRLAALPKADQNFYRFMMEAAALDNNTQDYINYGKELLKLIPGDLEIRMNIGKHLVELGRYAEAIPYFETVRNSLSNYPLANYYLAMIQIEQGNLEQALEYAQAEQKVNPKSEYPYIALGSIYMKQGKFPQAIKEFENALSLNPQSLDALMWLGEIKLGQNDYNMAREYYQRVLRHDKSKAVAHRQLGHIYRLIGQGKLALEAYQVYLDLMPNASDRREIEAKMKSLR